MINVAAWEFETIVCVLLFAWFSLAAVLAYIWTKALEKTTVVSEEIVERAISHKRK